MVRIHYYILVYAHPSSLLGSGKAKKKKDLLKYDVVLTTVRTHPIHPQSRNNFFFTCQQYMTLALEWPDLEAEEKAKAKKAKKKTVDFIASDSDDEPKTKKKRKAERTRFDIYSTE
jgi:hypothetical protein